MGFQGCGRRKNGFTYIGDREKTVQRRDAKWFKNVWFFYIFKPCAFPEEDTVFVSRSAVMLYGVQHVKAPVAVRAKGTGQRRIAVANVVSVLMGGVPGAL